MLVSCVAIVAAAAVALASPTKPNAKIGALSLKHVSNVKSFKSIVQKGQARIQKINGVKFATRNIDASSGPVTNEDVSYVASVNIGGQSWNLIVDTGCKLLLFRHRPNLCLTENSFQPRTRGAVPRAHASHLPRANPRAVLFRSVMVQARSPAASTRILSASVA